ncbi:MAG: hypothetical protein K8W52_33710 [Deltaproteobacteria bacterium]|nr:hypothetical protein [Deltaproteobacteria bacterium]
MTSTNAASQIVIDDDAGSPTMTKNVVIEVLDSSVPNLYPMRFTKGMFDTTYVDNQTLHLQPWVDRAGVDLYVVAQPPSYDYLRGISPGQDGQVITLLLTGTTTNFIGNATNLPADAAPLFVQSEACLPQNSTIRFLYRAGAWYELGRSTNNGGTGVLHGC